MNTATQPIRFTLLFKNLSSVHLHKDVGQIPYQLQKHHGFQSEILCRPTKSPFDYVESDLKGLKIVQANPYLYLIRNAKRIDALGVIHLKTESIYAILLYKFLNPKGVAYLKHDISTHELKYLSWNNVNFLSQIKRNLLFKLLLRKLDISSVECRKVHDKFDKFPASKQMLVPNGFDPEIAEYHGINPKSFDQKENIILLVGRHGTRQKNSELMLQALDIMGDIGDWRVYFIGPMTSGFERLKDTFLAEHPVLRDKVIFTGSIDDKKTLFDFYNRAKIFCLPSRWESWGLVAGEALCFGDVVIMAQGIISAPDLTDDGQAGIMLPGTEAGAWADTLTTLMNDGQLLASYSQRAVAHFKKNFIWKDLLSGLAARIRGLLQDNE